MEIVNGTQKPQLTDEKDTSEVSELQEEELNPGGEETLLDNTNIGSIALAPGEGQIPISLLTDELAEVLSFPTIYCGELRKTTTKLTYCNLSRSEIRRYDRRCARVDKILYAYKKHELEKISKAIPLCLRKKTGFGVAETASHLLDAEFVSELVQHDDGFKLFENIQSFIYMELFGLRMLQS